MKFPVVSLLVVGLLMETCVAASGSAAPTQMHIALAGLNGMRIMWFTPDKTDSSVCKYGLDTASMQEVSGSQFVYLEEHGAHHTVHLKNLAQDSVYYYSCGDGISMSQPFSFHTTPSKDATKPVSVAVFGDMGWLDSVQRPMGVLGAKTTAGNWSATFSRELMEKWKDNGDIDMVFHVGDVGYADDAVWHTLATLVQFEYEDAYNGYMAWIENVTATMPYHVSPGNHESECHDPACVVQPRKLGIPLSNFTAYNGRWAMPSAESGGVANMWYSWDYGAVHFVSIDSETDFNNAPENEKGDSGIFNAGKFAAEGTYMKWLEADLKDASENPDVSWIVAGGHRPFSSYSDENKKQLDDLFVKYGVSIYFAGHSHSYSRYSASDHSGVTTHITVGGAGCEEMLYSDTNPAPGKHVGTTCAEWASLLSPRDGKPHNKLSACDSAEFFTDAYAIGMLTVEDNGRGDMSWKLYSSIDGSVLDSAIWTKKQ